MVLPTKKIKETIRLAPNGRGFATFKKYNLKIYKVLVCVFSLTDLKKVSLLLNLDNVYKQIVVK